MCPPSLNREAAEESVLKCLLAFINTGTPLSFHRAIVQEVLLKHLAPSITCHLSSRLVSYAEVMTDANSPIQLTFADGKAATCDLLIGADGIKSVIRKQLVSENPKASSAEHSDHRSPDADPVWSGTFAYRCAVDSSVLRAKMPEHRALTTHVVVSKFYFEYGQLISPLTHVIPVLW